MNSEPKKTSPGSSKKTAIHRKPQRYPAYPRNPQLQCCDRKCRTSSTEMAVFFEGRQTQNSEDNIELGDGGGMTSVVWYFMGWLFFLKNPVSRQHLEIRNHCNIHQTMSVRATHQRAFYGLDQWLSAQFCSSSVAPSSSFSLIDNF